MMSAPRCVWTFPFSSLCADLHLHPDDFGDPRAYNLPARQHQISITVEEAQVALRLLAVSVGYTSQRIGTDVPPSHKSTPARRDIQRCHRSSRRCHPPPLPRDGKSTRSITFTGTSGDHLRSNCRVQFRRTQPAFVRGRSCRTYSCPVLAPERSHSLLLAIRGLLPQRPSSRRPALADTRADWPSDCSFRSTTRRQADREETQAGISDRPSGFNKATTCNSSNGQHRQSRATKTTLVDPGCSRSDGSASAQGVTRERRAVRHRLLVFDANSLMRSFLQLGRVPQGSSCCCHVAGSLSPRLRARRKRSPLGFNCLSCVTASNVASSAMLMFLVQMHRSSVRCSPQTSTRLVTFASTRSLSWRGLLHFCRVVTPVATSQR